MVDSTELLQNDKNWRRHGGAQRDAFDSLLQKVGIAGAVVAYPSARNNGRLTLIDGAMRTEAIQEEIPTLILDVTDEEADLLLLSYDRISAAANEDTTSLTALMEDIRKSDLGEMDMLFRTLGVDQSNDEPEPEKHEDKAEYPIEPVFDESYNYLVIFTKTEAEWRDVTSRLAPLKKKSAGKTGKPASSHVLTATDFMKAWDNRHG